jgi:cytidylate kinase
MMSTLISIDGPAASGKSTIARALAAHLGFQHLSSGNLYRLYALAAMQNHVDPSSPEEVARLLKVTEPGFDPGAERYFLDEEDVTDALSSREVSDVTSRMATNSAVRNRINQVLRSWCEGRDCVVEGRDIGTVVFPDAQLKVYLTASLEERAARRLRDFEGAGQSQTLASVMEDLESRDFRDGTRSLAPLKAAPDARQLDSTGKPVDGVVAEIATWLNRTS